MTEGNRNFQLDQALGFNVNRTAFLMSEEIATRFSKHGYQLSAQDFGILMRLAHEGELTQVRISELMMRDKTTITRRIDKLETKGLVERVRKPDDRRSFYIHLTPEGNKALNTLTPLVQALQQELLADVSDTDKEVTISVLKQISAKLIPLR